MAWLNSLKEGEDLSSHIVTDLPKDKLEYFLSNRKSEAFTQSAYIAKLNLLVLPQNYNISHIIHEINHMFGSHIISLMPYVVINGVSYSIEKGDMVVSENAEMNEVINQLMTVDIIEELKKLGVKVTYTPSWQDNAFALLMPFYNRFKDSLKKLYIIRNFLLMLNNFINIYCENSWNFSLSNWLINSI